jgi:DNA-binding MarR family transcriptional regulator
MESTMKSKEELMNELSQSVQRSGTLTVIHTNAIADKIGLSATEFEAVDIITNNQPVSAGQLATFCGLTTGAVTGLVDRLERAGFVRRKSDPGDRRRVLLEHVQVPQIESKVRQLYQPIAVAYETLLNKYSAEQLEFLLEYTNTLNDEVEKIIVEMKRK